MFKCLMFKCLSFSLSLGEPQTRGSLVRPWFGPGSAFLGPGLCMVKIFFTHLFRDVFLLRFFSRFGALLGAKMGPFGVCLGAEFRSPF